jgi:hypothetical protein
MPWVRVGQDIHYSDCLEMATAAAGRWRQALALWAMGNAEQDKRRISKQEASQWQQKRGENGKIEDVILIRQPGPGVVETCALVPLCIQYARDGWQ